MARLADFVAASQQALLIALPNSYAYAGFRRPETATRRVWRISGAPAGVFQAFDNLLCRRERRGDMQRRFRHYHSARLVPGGLRPTNLAAFTGQR